MATKWADYIITAVRFNSAGTHIEAVEIRVDNGDTAGPPSNASRAQVVAALEDGTTFCTATKGSDGKWHKGAAAKVITIDGQKYIRTKADRTTKDNLDDLPTL